MKIIVGGAGRVGQSIVSYLAQGNNDIIVIDTNQKKLDDLSQIYDLRPVVGSISHPRTLEKAGAKSADLLIAATDNDEANMISCQIAYSLFNLPQRIARIDNDAYLSPLWSPLYNEENIPVDLIISPAKEIASAAYRLLKVPGSSEYVSFFEERLYLLSFRCTCNCPLIQTPIHQLPMAAPELEASFIRISRKGQSFIPKPYDVLEIGDEITFLVEKNKIDAAILAFGVEKPAVERVVILGGDAIALNLARLIEADDSILSCKIIEENSSQARQLAKILNDTVVINGEMLKDSILDEATISRADMAIAVTDEDKDNLLISLLAHQKGATSVISLINSSSDNSLWDGIAANIPLHREAVTISCLLKELRHNNIEFAYSLGGGQGELWVIDINTNMSIVDHKISSLRLGSGIKIAALLRENEIIYPESNIILRTGDNIIIYVSSSHIRRAEQIFV